MTSRRSLRRRAAWAAPVAVLAAVSGATLLPSTASATDRPSLPAVTPAALLASVGQSSAQALSGTVVETARLGLPSLPGSENSASLSLSSLVMGSHTARVWIDGLERQRVALLGQLAESDMVHNGRDLWTYGSDTLKVTHAVLPAEKETAQAPDARALTPSAAAAQALAAVTPSTTVSVDPTTRVAGRPAYTLVLVPRDARSTVSRVTVAVDSATRVPLRVQIFGSASDAAFETGFTDVSFRRPAASVFRFTPPAGAKVTIQDLGTTKPAGEHSAGTRPEASAPAVVGTGWTSVLVLPASPRGAAKAPSGSDLLGKLTTTLPNGDRLLHTALVNVLMTHDGRTLVGAVSPELLQQAAG